MLSIFVAKKPSKFRRESALFFEENGFVCEKDDLSSFKKTLSEEIHVVISLVYSNHFIWFTKSNMANNLGIRKTNVAHLSIKHVRNKKLVLKLCESYERFIPVFDINHVMRFFRSSVNNKFDSFISSNGDYIIKCNDEIKVSKLEFKTFNM